MKGLKSLFKGLHTDSPTSSPPQAHAPSSTNTPSPPRRSRDEIAAPAPAHTQEPVPVERQEKTIPVTAMAPTATQQAEALVKRENEARAKRELVSYEGLPDGLVLGKKMGDGAFSNVFQATLRPNAAQLAIDPTLGKSVKVAVKCVRKYELSHSQVSPHPHFSIPTLPIPLSLARSPAGLDSHYCAPGRDGPPRAGATISPLASSPPHTRGTPSAVRSRFPSTGA